MAVGAAAFASFLGGALAGMWLRRAVIGRQLNDDSRHLLEIGLGIVGTMAGLVLGLLVSSATASYNAQRNELLDVSSKIVLLDRILAHYGSAANPARAALRSGVEQALAAVWPAQGTKRLQLEPSAIRGEVVLEDLEQLSATNDLQRALKPEATGLALNIAQTRWLLFEQSVSGVSTPLLVLLIFWFTITFIGFGLFSPPNTTVIIALVLCALAVSGAIFVMLGMYAPFSGLFRLSDVPLREALIHLGR